MHYDLINFNTMSNGYLYCDPIVMEVPLIKIHMHPTLSQFYFQGPFVHQIFVDYMSVLYHPSGCTHDMAITSTDVCLRSSHLIYKICFSGCITIQYCGHTE